MIVTQVLGVLTATVMVTFIATSVMIFELSSRANITPVRNLWAELRPFYLPAALFQLGLDVAKVDVLDFQTALKLVLSVLGVLAWWFLKDADHDDRWRRRRRKAAAKVHALASGRLAVVPTT